MLINKPKATVWLQFTQCAGTKCNNEPLTNANKMYYNYIIIYVIKILPRANQNNSLRKTMSY